MMAVGEGLGANETDMGLAILTDSAVYVVWLPILLGSKAFAERFNRWSKVDPKRVAEMFAAAEAERSEPRPPEMRHLLYLGAIAFGVTWAGSELSSVLPELPPVLSTSTWKVLVISTIAIGLSFTPARDIPGSHPIAMAIVYVFVARMGAQASLEGVGQAPAFLAGGFLWIAVHGGFCLVGARLLRVDVHSVAIASAANIGGAASAPVVAGYHRESLVPASILMAVIGYAVGNYLAILTGQLCYLVSGG
jgi:uncharacterized membrane protein